MRWCRFTLGDGASDGDPAFGIIEGDRVTAVSADTGAPFVAYQRTGDSHALADVKLLVPVIPSTFYAAGVNFREHVTHIAHLQGREPEFPPAADVGYRANNALIAHGETIVIPSDATDLVQYEGELVVVIGRTCHKVAESEALDYVFGYTIGNDVSERTWQRQDRTLWRAKNTDTFKPMGPWIETDLDPDEATVIIRVNGTQLYEYAIRDAIFGIREFISRMAQYLTHHPGDILWMGTDGPTENIKHGDTVEVEIPGIGVLSSPVVRAE
jgi:2-keto-4-pentenoate hydratase/2-oxohepta-3-ene-1,7-dioic acid hydratase in catechol pathway